MIATKFQRFTIALPKTIVILAWFKSLARISVNGAFPNWAMNYFRVDDPKGNAMIIKHDDPVDGLLPKEMPRELLHLFTRFMHIETQPA